MTHLNHVFLEGRLGSDPTPIATSTGGAMTIFTLASQQKFLKKDPKTGKTRPYYKTNWVNCVAFNASAQFMAKYTHKGDLIRVEGFLSTYKKVDKVGGYARENTQVQCTACENLSFQSKSLVSQQTTLEQGEEIAYADVDLSFAEDENPFTPAPTDDGNSDESEYAAYASDEPPF